MHDVACAASVLPDFFVHRRQFILADDPHRDPVGQLLRLQIPIVGEDPHVAEFVRHDRVELVGMV